MISVDDIERAVARLPPEDLVAFRAWFETFEAGQLDDRTSRDASEGRLDRFAEKALADRRQGLTREL